MRIGWVGGILRSREMLVRAARDAGHSLEVHFGDTGGRGAEGLSNLVDRCDLIVIVIEVNSHGGALQAKELARRRGRPAIMVRRSSISALQRVLAQLPTTAPLPTVAQLPAAATLPTAGARRYHGKPEARANSWTR